VANSPTMERMIVAVLSSRVVCGIKTLSVGYLQDLRLGNDGPFLFTTLNFLEVDFNLP